MTKKTMYMTERGFARLQEELARLQTEVLPELAEHLHDASTGSESTDGSELLMLRDELSFIENRVRELKAILGNAQLIERGEVDGKVQLGNTVVVQMNGDGPEIFMIVGSLEANPAEGQISNESPLGRALLDHAVGDVVTVAAPDGEMRFRIIAVT